MLSGFFNGDRSLTKGALAGLLPCLLACGAPAAPGELGSLEQAIVRGEPSDAADDSVVYVLSHEGGEASACTGTLVAPNLVLTALHCITYSDSGDFTCNADGTLSTNNPGDGNIGQLLPAANVEVFADSVSQVAEAVGVRLFGTGTTQICRNDLGLILLDRDLDAPLAALRLDTPVKRGERVRVVGFGQTELSGSSGRYRRTGRRIVDVGPDADADATPTTTALPRTFVIDEGPCHGDSGGPALSEETGALLGVYSLAFGATVESCMATGVRNVFTRANSFSSLILSAFDAAGAEPLLEVAEPEPRPRQASSGCALGASPRPHLACWGAGAAGLAAWLRRRRNNRSRASR